MRVEPTATFRSNPAPLPDKQCPAEQVRPDLQAIIPPLVQFRTNSRERRVIREQRKLYWSIDLSWGSAFRHVLILTGSFGLNRTIRAPGVATPRVDLTAQNAAEPVHARGPRLRPPLPRHSRSSRRERSSRRSLIGERQMKAIDRVAKIVMGAGLLASRSMLSWLFPASCRTATAPSRFTPCGRRGDNRRRDRPHGRADRPRTTNRRGFITEAVRKGREPWLAGIRTVPAPRATPALACIYRRHTGSAGFLELLTVPGGLSPLHPPGPHGSQRRQAGARPTGFRADVATQGVRPRRER